MSVKVEGQSMTALEAIALYCEYGVAVVCEDGTASYLEGWDSTCQS
jgi:hypothetical protein